MKTTLVLFALLFFAVTGCSTTPTDHKVASKAKALGPETVLITYRVIPGSEAAFEQILAEAWAIYRKERLVRAWPHIVVRDKEGEDRTGFVEIFTWVDHDAPDHPPKAVKEIWDRMLLLCETRNGHGGIEGGEVEIVQSSP